MVKAPKASWTRRARNLHVTRRPLNVPRMPSASTCLSSSLPPSAWPAWCSPAAVCRRPRADRWSRSSPSSAPGGGPSCTRSGSPPTAGQTTGRRASPLARSLHTKAGRRQPRAIRRSTGGQDNSRTDPHSVHSGSRQAPPLPAWVPAQAACRVAAHLLRPAGAEEAATGHRAAHGPWARTRPCWVTWGPVPYSYTEDTPTEDCNQERRGAGTRGHHHTVLF